MFTENRNIDDLDEKMRDRVKKWWNLCKKEGLELIITETLRTPARQKWLYSFGRFGVNKTKAKVTWTLNSNHLTGKAIDFVPLIGGKARYDAPKETWAKYYDLAEQVGLESLYRISGKDMPHLQLNEKWNPIKQNQIKQEEKILEQRMKKAWKALDEANATKRYLHELKGTKERLYTIIEET